MAAIQKADNNARSARLRSRYKVAEDNTNEIFEPRFLVELKIFRQN